ncbi:MAG: hypothetical protein OHK0037_12290 [Elainellaceae cyanobacterium]
MKLLEAFQSFDGRSKIANPKSRIKISRYQSLSVTANAQVAASRFSAGQVDAPQHCASRFGMKDGGVG